MARKRTFLFERAYTDYWARLKRFNRWLWSGCGRIWDFFWEGPAAKVLEVVLRLLVVASGFAAAAAFYVYEKNHGRGFSFGTLLAILVAAVYGWAVAWGWKAPVHVAARAVSATVASSVIGAVALSVLAAACVAFACYLAVLVALTSLSCVVFLPMLMAHWSWRLYHRITYQCPYDDCGCKGIPPIHVCSCGHHYDDLKPSFYGIFYHKCRHNDGYEKLPTLDLLGRKKLTRLCGRCKRPLLHSSFGELSERPIAIIGGPSVGKTVFMHQGIEHVMNRLRTFPRARVAFDSAEQEKLHCDTMRLLNVGQVVAKTGGDYMTALGLAVRIPKRLRTLLYFYDAPGEDFLTIERFGRKQSMQHVAGLVLMVDPFSLSALVGQGWRFGGGLNPSQGRLQDVVPRLVQVVHAMLIKRTSDKCKVPLAVVLSKADALPTQQYPYLAGLCPQNGDPLDPAHHARCRDALVRLGEEQAVRKLEQTFETVRYYAASSLGRIPQPRDNSPFKPAGVVEPFMWLLGLGGSPSEPTH